METREKVSPLRMFGALVGFLMVLVGAVVVPTQPAQATGACSTGATSAYGGGAGTSGDPYLISTPQQLALLSATSGDWGRHYKQTADIDLGGCQWSSIGHSATKFTGSYNGGGFEISGLRVADQAANNAAGLFGVIGAATISNLVVSGQVTSGENYVGGIVGEVSTGGLPPANITRVKSKVSVSYTGADYSGGILGFADFVNMSYSVFEGQFTASVGTAAGILGWGNSSANSVMVVDSYAKGNFSGTSTLKSGLHGWNAGKFTRSYSASTGVNAGVTAFDAEAESVFWDVTVGVASAKRDGSALSGATGLSSPEMKTITPFATANWRIIEGWEPFDTTSNKIWGICPSVNDGYPFLLWEYGSNPCSTASSGGGEARSFAPAIHLDVKAKVGDQIAGKPVEIAGTGLGSGSAYSLVVRSSPTTLDSGAANGSGAFSKTLQMPTLPAGTHSVTLTANASDGSTLTLVQTFTVSSNGVITSMSDPTGQVTKSLAATGVESQSAMWGFAVALALIAAGVLARAARGRVLIRKG